MKKMQNTNHREEGRERLMVSEGRRKGKDSDDGGEGEEEKERQ